MHAIVSSNGTRRWLSGVFLDSADAETSVATLAAQSSTQHVIEAIPIAQFPLFVIEERSGFTFLDRLGAAHAIAVMPAPPIDGEPILFAITSEFRPKVEGRDEMGRLKHVHLDLEHLTDLRRLGLCSLTE